MESKSSRFMHLGRRTRAIAVGLAIAGISVGFTACGDDEQDDLKQQADEVQENIDSALDELDTEELQQQAEEAQEQIESAVDEIDTEALEQQLQDKYGQ